MTKTYLKPTTKVYSIKTDCQLMQGTIDPGKATEPAGAKKHSFDIFNEEEEQPRETTTTDWWEDDWEEA